MRYLFFDTETRSKADLRAVGGWRYSEDPDADVLCIAWAVDDGKVQVAEPSAAAKFFKIPPGEDTRLVGRNVAFDYAIMCNVLIPRYGFHSDYANPDIYICTAALSRMHGLPASLEDSAEYLNKKFKKLPFGKDLIQKYCIPYTGKKTGERLFRELAGEDKKRMLEYNKIDVESDREAFKTLIKLPNVDIERAAFLHNYTLNAKGIRIDAPALDRVLNVFDEATADINSSQRKLTATITDKNRGTKETPLNVRSPKNLQAFLSPRGYVLDDCKIETIEQAYDDADTVGDEEVKKVLAWRMFCAKASIKKLAALRNRVSPDGRLRYFIKYFGAHTGRYAGEGFQVHNLPKAKWADGVDPCKEIDRMIKELNVKQSYKELIDWGKKIIPGLMIPDKGNIFIAGDFSAIEARGIAWLSGCTSMLREFAEDDKTGDKKKDLYSRTAKRIAGEQGKRQFGKVSILAPVYGMGSDKMRETAKKWGCDISDALAEKTIQYIRTTYKEIPAFWYALEDAFRKTWLSKQPHTVGKYIRMERGGNYLKIILPSGRAMLYHQIQIDSEGKISYLNFGKKGARVKVWGGTISENVTQAMCRDILDDRILACERAGYSVMLHVHDEIVIEAPKKSVKAKQKVFDKIMNTAPAWATGFPLKTESEIMTRYRK